MRLHLLHLLLVGYVAGTATPVGPSPNDPKPSNTTTPSPHSQTPLKRMWEQADPDTTVSVEILSTKKLSEQDFSKSAAAASSKSGKKGTSDYPYIMFNDAMGDVSSGFREYARIDKKLAKKKPESLALSYELTFSPGFEWSAKGRLGGLLPGLTGGKGRKSWRVQLAWDPDGRVKVSKQLAKQNRGGGKRPIETPSDAYWKPSPATNVVRLTVQQNGKKKRDGKLSVEVNGRRVALLSDVVYDWRGKGSTKFVLREGRYLGPNPTRGMDEIRYLTTKNLKVSEVDLSLETGGPPSDDFWDGSSPGGPTTSGPVVPPNAPDVPEEPEPPVGPVQPEFPPSSPGSSLPPSTNPKLVTLKWTQGTLATDAVAPRRLDPRTNELYLCSKDVLQFEWAGETGRGLGLYGFFNVEDWQACAKTPDAELNYMKNQRPSGLFKTKPNGSGWRWYASFDGADDGHCKFSCSDGKGISGGCNAKVAVNWDMKC